MSAKKKPKPKKKAAKKTKKKTVKKAATKPAKKKAATGKARPKKGASRKAGKKTTTRKAATRKVKATKAVKKKAGKSASRKAAKAKPKKQPASKVARKSSAKKAAPRTKAPARGKVKTPATGPTAPPSPSGQAADRVKPRKRRRPSRRAAVIRRGPDGEILAPGDLLLPGGARGTEEVQYMFRGCVAAEHPVDDEAIGEIIAKRGGTEEPGVREELQAELAGARERFEQGDLEPVIPVRANLRRTFQGVVDRARQRRREIGAFLRGLDMGHTETSHMDSHGEASLQSLMEWAARLENLVENFTEAPETNQSHYVQFHRVLDQLEASTEALIIDVEQTLRRLRDRLA